MGYIPNRIIADLEDELGRAHAKHGTQSLPLGTRNGGMNLVARAQAQATCDRHTHEGTLTWEDIIAEERAEAACEQDYERWRAETIQEAAMCIKAIADVDQHRVPGSGSVTNAQARALRDAAGKLFAAKAITAKVHSSNCPRWCGWLFPGHVANDPSPPVGLPFVVRTIDGVQRSYSIDCPSLATLESTKATKSG